MVLLVGAGYHIVRTYLTQRGGRYVEDSPPRPLRSFATSRRMVGMMLAVESWTSKKCWVLGAIDDDPPLSPGPIERKRVSGDTIYHVPRADSTVCARAAGHCRDTTSPSSCTTGGGVASPSSSVAHTIGGGTVVAHTIIPRSSQCGYSSI